MKNKFTVKLTLYFMAVLVIFTIVVGGVFHHLFKENTVEQKRKEMSERAVKIAKVISRDLTFLERRYGDEISRSRFINSLDSASPEIVWVVDMNRNLNMNTEFMQELLDSGRVRYEDIPANGGVAYKRLPAPIKDRVELAFEGKSFDLHEYNSYLGATMITVGEPVRDSVGRVRAVVLLHSPVKGVEDAIYQGLRILLISLLAALGLVLFLSAALSWSFTKPMNTLKNIVDRLANKEYTVRTNIKQQDEIGELAQKLDILAERLGLAEEESQKLEKLRREFIANISHELRTPVTVIKGSLEALRDGVITEPEDVAEFHGGFQTDVGGQRTDDGRADRLTDVHGEEDNGGGHEGVLLHLSAGDDDGIGDCGGAEHAGDAGRDHREYVGMGQQRHGQQHPRDKPGELQMRPGRNGQKRRDKTARRHAQKYQRQGKVAQRGVIGFVHEADEPVGEAAEEHAEHEHDEGDGQQHPVPEEIADVPQVDFSGGLDLVVHGQRGLLYGYGERIEHYRRAGSRQHEEQQVPAHAGAQQRCEDHGR